MRQEVPQLIHQVNQRLAVLDADVDVQAEDQVGARDDLHVLDDLQVALVGVDVLHAPVGERMRGAGDELQAVLLGERDHLPAQVAQIRRRFLDGLADARADLDHRLVHLGLHAFVQLPLALFEDLHLDVRAQVERDGIDRLVFLLDPEGEGRRLHWSSASQRCASRRGRPRGPCCTARSATAVTIHSKLSWPTERSSASGAGFMKSIAYGTPSSTANSTVFRS